MMTKPRNGSLSVSAWMREKLFNGEPFGQYLKAQLTPLNIIAALILLAGCPLLILRYTQGLGTVTHASNDQPWGLFLSWGLFTGVPLASTGFILASTVYLFGLKQYYPLLRPAVLTGFVGYFFAVVFLLVDLGQPWRLPYPLVRSYGTASVMFLVAWHVALYLSTQFVEFCPALFEWLGADRFRRWVLKVTIGATIFGVILSTLHQSALGALFLLAPAKVHPLWYSPYLPLLFFISSIYAGLSMVIVESALIRRFMPGRMDTKNARNLDRLTVGLGKGAAVVLLTYFGMKLIALAHGNHWNLLSSDYGFWFIIEMLALVLAPCFLFLVGVRHANAGVIRWAATWAILGLIFNRFMVSMFAFNWQLPHREFFQWKEITIVLAIVTLEILTYRWIVNRLPVHQEHPQYGHAHESSPRPGTPMPHSESLALR